eukprot:COSAG01_NODE_12078_length_1804_cov_1.690323_1_plen_242_part_00
MRVAAAGVASLAQDTLLKAATSTRQVDAAAPLDPAQCRAIDGATQPFRLELSPAEDFVAVCCASSAAVTVLSLPSLEQGACTSLAVHPSSPPYTHTHAYPSASASLHRTQPACPRGTSTYQSPPPPPSSPPDTPLTGLVGVGVAVCMMEAPSGHVHSCVWVGERSLAISHSHPSGGVDSGGGLVLGTLTDGSVADVAPVAAFQGGVTALCSGYLSDDVRNAIVSATPPPPPTPRPRRPSST